MDPGEFARLKQRAEDRRKAIDRRQGALDELRRRLKEEFGHDDQAQAEAALVELAQEEEALEKAVAREEARLRSECPELFQ